MQHTCFTRTHARAHTHTHTHTHARARARARARVRSKRETEIARQTDWLTETQTKKEGEKGRLFAGKLQTDSKHTLLSSTTHSLSLFTPTFTPFLHTQACMHTYSS